MESKTVKVPNVGCNGCVSTITSELKEIDGVIMVGGNPDTQMIAIEWKDPADWTAIKNKMVEIDYAPEEA